MTNSPVLDSAGRRRSPATMPGYHAGRPPRNKGMHYPADPPTVEEMVAVMRRAPDDRHGRRLRAIIVVLWSGGLRVQEALALTDNDLDVRRGSVLVRCGKGGRRREVGMDAWGWEHLSPWLTDRVELPVGPLFCVIDGPTRGRAWSSAAVRVTSVVECRGPRRVSPHGCSGRRETTVRAASAPPRPPCRARARGRRAEHHPTPARARQPRHHKHLPPRHRHRGDHRRRPREARTDDFRDCGAPALNSRSRRERRPSLPPR